MILSRLVIFQKGNDQSLGNAVTMRVGGGYISDADVISIGTDSRIGIRLEASGGVDIGSYTN